MPTDLRMKSNRWLRQVVCDKTFDTVLNVGCGADDDFEGGKYSEWFDCRDMIQVDVESFPNLTHQAESECLPLPDQSVDCIFANWMIYKTDVLRTLEEFHRVAKPDATVIVSFAADQKTNEIEQLRESIASYVNERDSVCIPYRPPSNRTERIAEIMYGTIRRSPIATSQVELRPNDYRQSLVVNIVPPVALIVAHWDDEVVSAGATLLKYGQGWDVICATRREHVSAFEDVFRQVCQSCGARPITLDIPHRKTPYKGGSVQDFYQTTERTKIRPKVFSAALDRSGIDLSKYNTVITHHFNGDIGGHPHHRQIAYAVSKLVPHKKLILFAPKHGPLHTEAAPEIIAGRNQLLECYLKVGREHIHSSWKPCVEELPGREQFARSGSISQWIYWCWLFRSRLSSVKASVLQRIDAKLVVLRRWIYRKRLGQSRCHTFSSYNEYVESQRKTNLAKQTSVWVRESELELVADTIRTRCQPAKFGICHGVRAGAEVKFLRETLGCEVIGTAISNSATKVDHVIEWDFHEVKEEWVGCADFIYSNSFDHSYDPEHCLKQWISCLRPDGLCFIHWGDGHNHHDFGMNNADCFQAPKQMYIQLLRSLGQFHGEICSPVGDGRSVLIGGPKA